MKTFKFEISKFKFWKKVDKYGGKSAENIQKKLIIKKLQCAFKNV